MIGNDEKYKVCSKSANYISCKAIQKILKVTRGALHERRKLFSSAIFVVNCRIYETFLQCQNMQVKAFSHISFKTMAVPFNHAMRLQ